MEKEMKITAPKGCEIEKVEIVDGVAVVTFRNKKRELPKSWEEFCDMFPIKQGECFINAASEMYYYRLEKIRGVTSDRNIFPDRATAGAVLALMQLIQLRNAYNGDWVPNWNDADEKKYIIACGDCGDIEHWTAYSACRLLAFKTAELRDEFLRCFRPLIEKLKPLYGIKEGGAK